MNLTHPNYGGDSIYSIGMASQLLQAMPDKIRLAARQLGIEPSVTINGVSHYASSDVERIGKILRAAPPAALQLQ